MSTLDGWLEGFLQGPTTLWVGPVVSLLLGLRHASDPDHLAAVTTLIASQERERIRKATSLGLLWGLGHGTTLVLVGLPLVLLGQYLPERVAQAAEVAIGLIIVMLAVRLLVRWRRCVFHAHAHSNTKAARPTATSTRTRAAGYLLGTSTPTTRMGFARSSRPTGWGSCTALAARAGSRCSCCPPSRSPQQPSWRS